MGEPTQLSIDFDYNYYVHNESSIIIDKSDKSFSKHDLKGQEKDLIFLSATDRVPKANIITISGPTGTNNTTSASGINYGLLSAAAQSLSREVLKSKINIEAANSTLYYSGFELIDTDAQKSAYKNLLNNPFITSQADASQFSNGGIADIAADSLEGTTIYGTSCKEIIKNIINTKSSGVTYANTDINLENVENFTRDASFSNINVSIKCANLFFSDIYKRASRMGSSVFASENRAITPIANAKTKYLTDHYSTDLGYGISEMEFDIDIDSIGTITDSEAENISSYSITHVGYVIKKEERDSFGNSIIFEDIVRITENENLTIVDPNIRYGGFYIYTARSLYEVVAPMYRYDGLTKNESYSYERFLIASEGITKSVHCTENIPPPPPVAIRGRIDFRHRVPKILWQFPVNPQRDITRFQIFKRESIDLPFTLCAEYNFESNPLAAVKEVAQSKNLYKMKRPKLAYTDYKYKEGSSPIYAIASVDAHGMTSHLSTQISVKYNKHMNKGEVKMVSRENAPKPYPNIFIEKDLFLDAIKLSHHDRMTVFFDPDAFVVKKTDNEAGEYDLNLLSINTDQATYKFHIVNLDSIENKEISIKIVDKHAYDIEEMHKVADFNEANLTFT